ncbi:hypothetical protein L1887_32701 [Cichorium endivia]|nr:hypothetical protein L1887_32701 [Cichorium endivia]
MSDLWDQLAFTEDLKAFKPYIDRRKEQCLVQFFMALRSDFEGLHVSILHHTPLPTVESVVHELIAEEIRIKSKLTKVPRHLPLLISLLFPNYLRLQTRIAPNFHLFQTQILPLQSTSDAPPGVSSSHANPTKQPARLQAAVVTGQAGPLSGARRVTPPPLPPHLPAGQLPRSSTSTRILPVVAGG